MQNCETNWYIGSKVEIHKDKIEITKQILVIIEQSNCKITVTLEYLHKL